MALSLYMHMDMDMDMDMDTDMDMDMDMDSCSNGFLASIPRRPTLSLQAGRGNGL